MPPRRVGFSHGKTGDARAASVVDQGFTSRVTATSRRYGPTPCSMIDGAYSWCAKSRSVGTVAGRTSAARIVPASRIRASPAGVESTSEYAVQPTTLTAASVAAAAHAQDAGVDGTLRRGASTVGSPASLLATAAADVARHGDLAAQRVADRVVARPRRHRFAALEARADGVQLRRVDVAIHQARNVLAHYHLRLSSVPSIGRNSAAIDSRARKIRERTVPIGQFITAAISS